MDLATECRTGQPIDVDVGRPRAIGIFGKRGSGKTITLIEIAGAAAKLGHLVIVVDPLSAIRPPGHRRVHLGPAPEGEFRLWLDPTAMTPDACLALFELKMSDPMGISLFRAVLELNEGGGWWSVQDLIEQVHLDDRAADKTKDALENRLALARSWGIFSHEQIDPLDVFQAGVVNVLDVGAWEPGPQSLRNLAVRLLADRLFAARRAAWAGSRNGPALSDVLSDVLSLSKGLLPSDVLSLVEGLVEGPVEGPVACPERRPEPVEGPSRREGPCEWDAAGGAGGRGVRRSTYPLRPVIYRNR